MTNKDKIKLLEVRKANLESRPKDNKNVIMKINRKIRILSNQL